MAVTQPMTLRVLARGPLADRGVGGVCVCVWGGGERRSTRSVNRDGHIREKHKSSNNMKFKILFTTHVRRFTFDEEPGPNEGDFATLDGASKAIF